MKTNRHSHSSNKGPLQFHGTVGEVGLNHNFELLLTQIICRRLNLEQGIVSLGVGLTYDLLRFIPCSTICFHPLQSTFCWGINHFIFFLLGSLFVINTVLFIFENFCLSCRVKATAYLKFIHLVLIKMHINF